MPNILKDILRLCGCACSCCPKPTPPGQPGAPGTGPREVKVEDLIVPPSGPSGSVNPAEFSLTQIFDIGWLLDPGCQRLLDNLAASPVAFQTVRIMKVFTNSINPPTAAPESGMAATTSSGTVWPLGGTIDLTGTLDALYQLTSRSLTPFIVLGFFPPGIYNGTSAPPAGPIGPYNPTSMDWTTILTNWKTLVKTLLDTLLADSRFGAATIEKWWFEVWNEPDEGMFWMVDWGGFPGPTGLVYYQQLYQATSDVLKTNGYKIRLGGPAITSPNVNATGLPSIPSGMSQFITFVQSTGARCDFLSFHGKGDWTKCLNAPPDFQSVVNPADYTAQLAKTAGLSSITIVNSEADMRAFFAIPFKPRMTQQFPAWLCALMIAYDSLSSQYAPMRFMAGSDNGEPQLNAYTQGFSSNTPPFAPVAFGQERSIVTAASTWSTGCPTDLLKVPVYNYYELLRLLGDQHGTFLTGSNNYYPHNSDLFHLISVATSHIGSVFCVYPPTPNGPSNTWTLNYSIVGITWPTINWYQFQIDAALSNSFSAADGPRIEPDATSCNPTRLPVTSLPWPLSTTTVQHIRANQELAVAASERNVTLSAGTFNTKLTLNLYTTTVIWITPYTTTAPSAPVWLTTSPAVPYPANYGTNIQNVLLRWQPDNDPAFYSYEVYRDNQEVPISPIPLRSALWIDTDVTAGQHTYWILTRSPSGIASVMSQPMVVSV